MLSVSAALAVGALLALWLFRRLRSDLWTRLRLPAASAWPLVGNFGAVLMQKKAMHEIIRDLYRKHEGLPFVGIYEFMKPALLVRDPELVRAVLTKHFAHFHDNSFDIDPKLDSLLSLNPFFLRGERWKTVRAQLAPAFSSGRIRTLLGPMRNVSAELAAYTRKQGPSALPDGLDVKELAAKFTTEVVSSVALGVRANSFRDADAEIRRMGRRILQPDSWRTFLLTLELFIPQLRTILRVGFMSPEVESFFRRLVGEAIKYREQSDTERNDFLQLLLGFKKKHLESGDHSYGDTEITAHAITFFTDGFETSSVALAFLLHDLSGAPADQQRLRSELNALDATDPEAILHAPFLDACLKESLRLHPPGGFLEKKVTQPFTLPRPMAFGGGEAVLPLGTHVILPLWGLHTDPAYFEEPHAFRPQRFLEGEPPKGAFLPFGDGPRQCIGMRFAQAQVKFGAAALVQAFDLQRTPRSPPDPVKQDPKNFLMAAQGGLWINFWPLEP